MHKHSVGFETLGQLDVSQSFRKPSTWINLANALSLQIEDLMVSGLKLMKGEFFFNAVTDYTAW